MPQTRFVLRKALELNKKCVVVVNKVDRPEARPYEVVDEALEECLDSHNADWNRIKEETTGSSFNRKHSKKYEKWKSNFKNNKDYYNNTLRDAKKDRIEFDKELK